MHYRYAIKICYKDVLYTYATKIYNTDMHTVSCWGWCISYVENTHKHSSAQCYWQKQSWCVCSLRLRDISSGPCLRWCWNVVRKLGTCTALGDFSCYHGFLLPLPHNYPSFCWCRRCVQNTNMFVYHLACLLGFHHLTYMLGASVGGWGREMGQSTRIRVQAKTKYTCSTRCSTTYQQRWRFGSRIGGRGDF